MLGRKYQSGLKDIIGFLNTQNNDELFNEYESTGKFVLKNNNKFNLIQEDIIIKTTCRRFLSSKW